MDYLRTNLSDPAQKEAYIEYIRELTGEYELLHYPVLKRRTIPQNKLYRVYLTLISQETGHSEGFIHRQMKALYGRVVKADPNADDSTKNMTRTQFMSFMDLVLQHYFDFLGKDADEEYYP